MKSSILSAAMVCLTFFTGGDNTDMEKEERARLEGTWTAIRTERQGLEESVRIKLQYSITKDKITVRYMDSANPLSYKLGLDANPKTIDLISLEGPFKGKAVQGIYEIHDDVLILCTNYRGRPIRPKQFLTHRDDDGQSIHILLRQVE